ncbi:MAG: alpha-amylase family glycosyl hydrolase [Bacteroidales bacterium]|jgi:glycosidase|nr:alpha-amylase family glycosyl hydrolase [Bacteroidales bacterium]MCI2144754.1 alpha-amylase family glycosyl hydrolase [Bacteroidales bacterium]
MNIYEILLRAFGSRECHKNGTFYGNGSGKFSDISDEVLDSISAMQIDAVWYAGVIAHASKTEFIRVQKCNPAIVKGECGSPFAIRDYADVAPELADKVPARMKEFAAMVARTHRHGMKVIIDFVPNHVAREYESDRFKFTDENFYMLNSPLVLPDRVEGNYFENPAKASGNDVFSPTPSITDWYETVKLNYNSRSTWEIMTSVLKFWASKGVDGFRCDMVEMVPADFFGYAISEVRKEYPDTVFIGEAYNPGNYKIYRSAGFDLLYDKVGMHDTLLDIIKGDKPASSITKVWQSLGNLQDNMLNFLENHDEMRIASDFVTGAVSKRAESLFKTPAARGAALIGAHAQICAAAVATLFNKASFLIYFGQEFAEAGMQNEGFSKVDGKTSIYDYCIVPSIKRHLEGKSIPPETKTRNAYLRLMKRSVTSPFLTGKTFDLEYCNPLSNMFDPESQFAFMRSDGKRHSLVVANFSPESKTVYVTIPALAFEYLGLVETKYFNPHTPRCVEVKAFDYTVMPIY